MPGPWKARWTFRRSIPQPPAGTGCRYAFSSGDSFSAARLSFKSSIRKYLDWHADEDRPIRLIDYVFDVKWGNRGGVSSLARRPQVTTRLAVLRVEGQYAMQSLEGVNDLLAKPGRCCPLNQGLKLPAHAPRGMHDVGPRARRRFGAHGHAILAP